MNLKKLKYFRVVAEELNFGLAAEKLYVDQSSISRAINGLEVTLGVCLFERHLRKLKLTEQGYMLLEDVNEIVCLIDRMTHRIKESQQKKQQTLEVAISPNTDVYRVSELLRIYREQYPHMQLNIHEASYQNILYGLKQGQYHFALSLHKPNLQDSELIFERLWQEKLVVLLSKRHPLVSFPVVSIEDIKNFPFISFQPDTLLHEVIYTTNFNPPRTFFVKSYSILQSLIMSGYGISLVTENMHKNMQSHHIVSRNMQQPLLVDTYLLYQQDQEILSEQMACIIKLFSMFLK